MRRGGPVEAGKCEAEGSHDRTGRAPVPSRGPLSVGGRILNDIMIRPNAITGKGTSAKSKNWTATRVDGPTPSRGLPYPDSGGRPSLRIVVIGRNRCR